MSNAPVMDSPDVLGHALCRHVPDMCKGFTIQTRHGDIYVTADDAAPFADAMERLLMSKIRQIQGMGSPERDKQLHQAFHVINSIELAEHCIMPKFKGAIESAHQNAKASAPTRDFQARVDQLLREATRENGKCMLSREEALQILQTTSAFHTASSEPQVNEPIHQHACFAQHDCNRHKPVSTEFQDGVTPRGSHEPSPLADQTLQEIPPLTSRLHAHSFCLIVPLAAYTHCLSLVQPPCSEEEKSKYHKKQGQ